MLLIKFKCINMNWLKKFFGLFESKKTKLLKSLGTGDKINIYPPEGYHITVNGNFYENQVIQITIFNNDPNSKKIWFYHIIGEDNVCFVKHYNSEVFEDFCLLNCRTEPQQEKPKPKPKSKKELEKEMQKAISEENYELANLLNEEIKKLEDASN